jgi:hypothetical protein
LLNPTGVVATVVLYESLITNQQSRVVIKARKSLKNKANGRVISDHPVVVG